MSNQLSAAQQAAAAVMDDVRQEVAAEAAAAAPVEPETAVEPVTEEEDPFNQELPPDILENLEEGPEDTYEEEEEPDFTVEDDGEEYVDEDVQRERNKRIALEKKLKWMEQQDLKRRRKDWVEKDGKYFPFANVQEIAEKASSRKEFDRLAQAENDRIKSLPGIQKLVAAQKGETVAEPEGPSVSEVWGRPTVAASPAPIESAEYLAEVKKAQERRDSRGVIKAMLKHGKI